MSEKREDKRVRRTKRLLREALLRLMEEKPIERITTTALCAEADINRNTFYTYYAAPEDVLSELEDEAVARLEAALAESYGKGDITLGILEFIASNQQLFRTLWRSGSSHFLERGVDYACDRAVQYWRDEGREHMREGELFTRFAAYGSIGITEQWLFGGCKESPAEVGALINRFVALGMGAIRPQT